MPGRGHSTAPTFSGDALDLDRFFEEVDILADDAGLDDAGKIKHSLRYARREEYELWSTLVPAVGDSFDDFKAAVKKLYPGADDDRRYSVADLERLTKKQAEYGIENRAELGQYYRDFIRIVTFLKAKNRISDNEVNRAYERGFDDNLRERVRTRLQFKFPDHFYDDPYPLEQFHECAHFLLAGTAAGTVTSAAISAIPPTRSPSHVAKTEQKEPSLAEAIREISVQLATAFNQSLHASKPPTTSGPTTQRASYANSGEEMKCLFDGGPHRIRDCPRVSEYIRDGKCQRNDANHIVLPNGNYIPRTITGRNMMERIDKWHESNPTAPAPPAPVRDPPPHMTQNLLEVVSPQVAANLSTTVPDDDELVVRVLEAEVEKRKKRVRFDGVEVPSRRQEKRKEEAPSAEQSTPERSTLPASALPKPAKVPTPSTSTTPPTTTPPTTTPVAPGSGPQYRYVSPAEDPVVLKTIMNRALDSAVNLSQRELLSISPELRKQYREYTTTKRIPAEQGSVEVATIDVLTNINHLPVRECKDCQQVLPLVVADDSVALRAVFPVIEGKVSPECLLDLGSQVVSMHESVWKKIGNNLRPNENLSMESANSAVTTTSGRCKNVKFSFGEIDLFLQIQVVKEAPYEVLLGRPFHTLTNCITRDFSNGDQHITITDPNTGLVVTIPTKERKRHPGFNFPDDPEPTGF
ncbi:MAG: hypothetical protein QOE33_3695 [Acidobacteriota bacterium]|nr:hypothetical protein [Acidobacteriota bacterium]